MKGLLRGALVQLHVVHALILRETRTRFGQHQLGYLWALLEPMIWIGTFAGLYTVAQRRVPAGMDIVGFLATGVVTYQLFSSCAGKVSEAINGNRALLFYPQVQPLDLAIARLVLEAATLITVFTLIVGLNMLAMHDVVGADDLLRVAMGLTLAALLGGSLGLFLCMLGVLSGAVERLRGPLMRPLFWISGLFFTVEDLPPHARDLALINPVLHCVELVRSGWYHSYRAPHASPSYILMIALTLMFVGLLLERAVRHRVELS
jgi:capsular polysaccharide transport system permease protein